MRESKDRQTNGLTDRGYQKFAIKKLQAKHLFYKSILMYLFIYFIQCKKRIMSFKPHLIDIPPCEMNRGSCQNNVICHNACNNPACSH